MACRIRNFLAVKEVVGNTALMPNAADNVIPESCPLINYVPAAIFFHKSVIVQNR